MNKINKNNSPEQAINRQEEVSSNDRKMKQDFSGYPHYPASENALNRRDENDSTELTSEDDTTATGSESVREQRPTGEQNSTGSKEELKKGSDRGLMQHDVSENTFDEDAESKERGD
jgi:hypothetical protein